MNDKMLKKLKIGFTGKHSWRGLRELIISKMRDAQTEEEFGDVIKKLIASMFDSSKELDKARKQFRLEALTEQEKKDFEVKT